MLPLKVPASQRQLLTDVEDVEDVPDFGGHERQLAELDALAFALNVPVEQLYLTPPLHQYPG